ncbi:F-box/kelch-repeat protein [Prunus yedoensis var. nudiflora]|uniref:F-box/kelch-repeat protein n=1 Tax=Prunus yedoensis var. nudiflora TaxID=2094558 RepID=A0A314ZDW0_PRUYE|nr:F-box/kelch-repeat protein [Prunus yedoensis var. nudiflora]
MRSSTFPDQVIINLSWIHGSNWGLKPAKFMALTDTWAMRGGRYKLGSNYFGSRTFVMEFESDWTKHRKLPAYTAHVMRSATSFMPCPILPGLPDDIAKHCLALVPRSNFPVMSGVCKKWRHFIQSKELITVRKLAGVLEEWLYVLTTDSRGKPSHWEVLDCLGRKHHILPSMPGPMRSGGTSVASEDVYQYDSCLNRWGKLASLHVARHDFACAEVSGMIYAVGGFGIDGSSLSSAEVYNPDTDTWTLIESLRRPRYGCFACGFEGKLYVMGGRSSFTIGNSKFVDVYDPEKHTWCEMKNGCVMVTAHAVLEKKLFCLEWKNQRKLSIYNPEDNSWEMVQIPLTGSTSIKFRFGILGEKLLLFSLEEEPGYRTLLYDPNATPGSEWQTSEVKPSGPCFCCVTIKV